MLKVEAKSKRGFKQIRRHGNLWVPVQAEKKVACLGGAAGVRLMSLRDRATFWMKVTDDENLVVVDRLDHTGKSLLPPRPGRTHVEMNVDWDKVSDTTSQLTVKS